MLAPSLFLLLDDEAFLKDTDQLLSPRAARETEYDKHFKFSIGLSCPVLVGLFLGFLELAWTIDLTLPKGWKGWRKAKTLCKKVGAIMVAGSYPVVRSYHCANFQLFQLGKSLGYHPTLLVWLLKYRR